MGLRMPRGSGTPARHRPDLHRATQLEPVRQNRTRSPAKASVAGASAYYFQITTTPDDGTATEKFETVAALLLKTRDEVGAILIQEHESWQNALDQASIRFDEMIKGATEQARKDYDARRVEVNTEMAAQQTGDIEVQLNNRERLNGDKIIAGVDDKSPKTFERPPQSFVFNKQPPGLRMITLQWSDGSPMLAKSVDVIPGKVTQVQVDIPQSH